jgi:cytochrome c peroxidase
MKGKILLACLSILFSAILVTPSQALTLMEELGKAIFFDENLSARGNQSCATCHAPNWGFTGPDSAINSGPAVYPGSLALPPGQIENRFGNRKPPSAAYGGDSPILYFDDFEGLWIGGMFWDGRATGERLGHPLADQALGPFLNPLEQALPNGAAVVDAVCKGSYALDFITLCGDFIGDDPCLPANADAAYDCIGLAIAAYEQSSEVNPFSSRYDEYLAGDGTALTDQEKDGLELFQGKAMCTLCHISEGQGALFTDFTYDNLGVPKNPENPFYYADEQYNPDGTSWVDLGLGSFLQSIGEKAKVYKKQYGKVKVPTLRNVGKKPAGGVKAYGHNGYFKSLYDIVHFYNTRDTLPTCPPQPPFVPVAPPVPLEEGVDCWPMAEVPKNVNRAELGNLGLTLQEELDIVAFMEALSDQ